jgi:predicted RND superfamily exporter protein
MGLSRVFGQSVFFISYLICLSIQMGATIDYGILLSDQYRMIRLGGKLPKEALQEALNKALPTVLTSGVILITAGFIIGIQCSIYYISSIGLLISRGALMSVLLVLLLLPALLSLFDRGIIRK